MNKIITFQNDGKKEDLEDLDNKVNKFFKKNDVEVISISRSNWFDVILSKNVHFITVLYNEQK